MAIEKAARFFRMWRRLHDGAYPKLNGAGVLLDLKRRYSEPGRYYHNLTHIADGLEELDLVRVYLQEPTEVAVAWWFHDAVYDPKAKDNEERSAELISKRLGESRVNLSRVLRAKSLVLISKHSTDPVTNDERFLVDIDLSILGKPFEKFRMYDEAIRKEYAWVADEDYRRGRTVVLKSFLERSSVYFTEYFRERYAVQARENLERAISALGV